MIGKGKKRTSITSFFQKSSPPKSIPHALAPGPSCLPSTVTIKPLSIAPKSPETLRDAPTNFQALSPAVNLDSLTPLARLTSSLQSLVCSYSSAIPEATAVSDIARVTGDPCDLVSDPDEAWEMLNPIIHSVFGYQANPDTVRHLVRRGQFGIEGFCDWVMACAKKLHVDSALLEPKVQLLLEATQTA
ncbi:hypothetical protein BT96DRAFT_1003710 [Gymnopus androsaceus JB14]|uniref:Uncharacterized protein n=1 Tax=Gymnopus androsaceus JB14 TaxID=1447944 RepID=A0A6A4GU24_9AGAR|nr:hypothetical protein BT96DRAFT_1003710 [Gymnopus androsaceus JB14]